ncbi:hypothetical protein BKP45_08035 [Anaerobacillus alkalidiazotrophicus]|uniref:Uncharacterized protein n=1 Tax=Anaerobacillus alkalidiazotrophicus TaxID=472963 RepID=A0A1S2M8A9_9BACI|nr:hypothetical protein BKP45_08035 [Anaerobacillus alkalidiazotrophicus]
MKKIKIAFYELLAAFIILFFVYIVSNSFFVINQSTKPYIIFISLLIFWIGKYSVINRKK